MIKKVFLGLVAVFGLLYGEDLLWQPNVQSAFAEASRLQKPLMVMIEGEHCQWCKKMEHQTLEDETISKRLKSFVLVKVIKESPNAKEFPPVEYVPTIFFMTPDKKLLERVTGYFEVLDFASWIDGVETKLKQPK
jgi:thioredoxin-related protein